jgi:hypothetical protein
MNKIFDRKPETERLIAFLSRDTEIRLIKYEELIKATASGNCKTVNDIRGYLSSARRIMREKHDVKYGTIRGEGIQRMNADEVGFYGNKRRKRAAKQLKEGLKDNRTIAGSNTLSAEAQATRDVNNVIFTKLLHELEGVKKMIKVATQNGAQAVADILASMNRPQA